MPGKKAWEKLSSAQFSNRQNLSGKMRTVIKIKIVPANALSFFKNVSTLLSLDEAIFISASAAFYTFHIGQVSNYSEYQQ